MNFEQIIYEVEDRVAIITLNRPDAMNAWTVTMMNEILTALDLADEDDEVRAVIFTGAGRAFCAGADLSSRSSKGASEGASSNDSVVNTSSTHATRDTAGRVTLRMFEMKKPLIGAINGNAVGVGMTMPLAMDIRIASEAAGKMGFVFDRRGITPEGCSTYFLPRIVGISLATELILTGRLFNAKEGLEMGLFSRVVPPEELMNTAKAIARDIADNTSAISTVLARQMLWQMLTARHPMEAHIIESKALSHMFRASDAAEGIMSFMEKRPPRFKLKPSTDLPDFYPWWEKPDCPEEL
ncbi:MAG: crotonase/enoyl-CoA hydratase family protein [Proteobacteria bacterium]|nr:crotonase/enoyl-CoA hydratase family protein [Pseudomonadota bacterium]MBU4055202.1 crotonase/enoyl-CoA hydratase family protein [Pseudomonadota bacterium]